MRGATTIRARSGVLGLPRTLELDDTTLRSSGGLRPREIPLSGAQVRLGTWVLPGAFTAIGAALAVEAREGRLVVGVRDRAVPRDDRTMPGVTTVDLVVDRADFDALCAALLPEAGAVQPAAERAHVFDLVRNRVSGLGSLEAMKPWFLTLLFLAVVGPLGGLTIGDSRAGSALLTLVAVVAIAFGIVATVRGASRPPPLHSLEVGRESIVLRDPDGAILVELRAGDATLERGVYRVASRAGSFDVPTLTLAAGGRVVLRLGVWDSRFASDDGAKKTPAPRFLASALDWPGLLDALGLHGTASGREGTTL